MDILKRLYKWASVKLEYWPLNLSDHDVEKEIRETVSAPTYMVEGDNIRTLETKPIPHRAPAPTLGEELKRGVFSNEHDS